METYRHRQYSLFTDLLGGIFSYFCQFHDVQLLAWHVMKTMKVKETKELQTENRKSEIIPT